MIENSKKKISLFSATALSATSMVGSGWLFSAQLNAKLAGNYAFLAWIFAAMLAMGVGLCLAQVVAIFPVRGATSRSSALSHNGVFGMPFAFANWFGIVVTVATEAQASTEYLSAAMNNHILMYESGLLTLQGKFLSLGILFIYLIINYYGIKVLARINNTVTILKIFTPLFAISLFLIAKFDVSNFTLASNTNYGLSSAIGAIVSAGLIYSYNGFQLSVAFASEINNPKRNVPLSIVISILMVMGVYMLLQTAFMGAVPHYMLADGWSSLNFHSPLMNLAILLGMNFLAVLLIADSIISPSGTGYAYLGGAARMFYGMAAEGQMPKWTISKLHPVFNLCRRSMLINWILTSIVLWYADSWASLMVVVTGYHIIGYMAAPISMGAIKPKTRILGVIVFVVLGMVMTTVPQTTLKAMNISLMVIMFIFCAIQLTKHVKIKHLFCLTMPFIIYLWLVYLYHDARYVAILSAVFYYIITHQRYVPFCKATKALSLQLEEDIHEVNKI